ncbi:MAG: hypothetical protein RXO76_07685 [Vulcanisaeta sp.]
MATVRFDGSIGRVVLKPTIPRDYSGLLDAVLTERIKYVGRVVWSMSLPAPSRIARLILSALTSTPLVNLPLFRLCLAMCS